MWDGAKALGQLEQRKAEAAAFNAQHRWRKRGVAMTPVKYGMGWAGLKASASVRVYQEDGSVLINHHGCEVGQGIHTKVGTAPIKRMQSVSAGSQFHTPTTCQSHRWRRQRPTSWECPWTASPSRPPPPTR